MTNTEFPNPAPMPRQRFFVPRRAPFLELRTTLDSTLPYAEHVHPAFSLGLILQGKTRFTLNSAEYLAEEGDIVLIGEGRAHSCNPVDGPRGYHMLLIDADWLRGRLSREPGGPHIRDAALFRKAVAVVEAILADRDDAAVLLIALLCELCARHGNTTGQAEGNEEGNGRQSAVDWPGWSELGGADEAPSVSRLAHTAGMCRESFSRAVRRKTGLPPSLYLHCLRLEKARRLLRQGASIAEAALAAGYADQSHFHRMFVRFCAVTPGSYRRGMSHPFKNSPDKKAKVARALSR